MCTLIDNDKQRRARSGNSLGDFSMNREREKERERVREKVDR